MATASAILVAVSKIKKKQKEVEEETPTHEALRDLKNEILKCKVRVRLTPKGRNILKQTGLQDEIDKILK